MAITALYVDGSAGADTNGGSSAGAAIVSGASADTDGTTTVSLSDDTPDLSGVSVGDSIRLASEGGAGQGSNSDIFEITAVDDGADTVTVTPTPGTNANQAWAIGGALATVDKAMNTVVAGNKVWVKASATYSETATIDTAGASGSPITFEGYTSSIGDDGRATVDGGSARASGFASGLGAVSAYYVLKNFIVQNCTGTGFGIGTATDQVTFINCRANNNGGWGFQIDNSGIFMLCDAYSNTSGGIDGDSSCMALASRAHSNSGPGVFFNVGSPILWNCLIYNNSTADGANAGSQGAIVIGCTLDGENTGDEGVVFGSGGTRYVFINNIVYDWATGLSAGVDLGEEAIVFNNLFNSNTANTANIVEGENKVTSAPGFTDEGSDDYTLASGSAAKAAGLDVAIASLGTSYVDIGALQRQEAGGGGGLLVHPGTSGGARG